MALGFASLGDMEARQAFVHTVRGIMDISGQRVSARDRLYLAAEVPTLLVWGEHDRMIPVLARPGGARGDARQPLHRLRGRGSLPALHHPWRFASDLLDFIEETLPAVVDEDEVRELMRRGG